MLISLLLQEVTEQVQDSAALDPLTTESSRSLIDIIGLAGGFQWPIMIVFILGLGALMHTLVRLYQDDRQSRVLREIDLSASKTKDIREAADLPGQSVYHEILKGLARHGKFAPNHASRVQTVAAAVATQQGSFTLTHKLVTYCSGAAGGLGLAGTLVGMYSSFAAAGTDPSTVYAGISLALVSTLLGVAVSLILEAADTFVHRYAAQYLAKGKDWGEEVCVRLSDLARTAARIQASRKSSKKPPPKGGSKSSK